VFDESNRASRLCHVCGSEDQVIIRAYEKLNRVTSDCQICRPNGQLTVCCACGTVQKPITRLWLDEVNQIYINYDIYHQGKGAEQPVFETFGQVMARSERILKKLVAVVDIPDKGRLLDIGCGNGSFLRAFGRIRPEWSLAGTELNDKYIQSVMSIPGIEKLYNCDPCDVEGKFDLISMIHVLEHVVNPYEYLEHLQNKLAPNGLMLIEVPNYLKNPFDLLIADHATHFQVESITNLLKCSGWDTNFLTGDWVPKEISVISRRGGGIFEVTTPCGKSCDEVVEGVNLRVSWLKQTVDLARLVSNESRIFGIFGTSIAATWLYSELEPSRVNFFVDEDLNRVGSKFMGRRVFHPEDAPDGAVVFVPLPPEISRVVANRLTCTRVVYQAPGDFALADSVKS
jgi:2-polyprenyl-3-methyl-5-hydroxy-6-metoxy-1,4-benzoquinol methylase